jgi:nucleoid DNA-binding protein
MEKNDFTKRFAQRTRSTRAVAADQVDRVVNDLLRRLRAGKAASLPGLGTLLPPVSDAKSQIPNARGRAKKVSP